VQREVSHRRATIAIRQRRRDEPDDMPDAPSRRHEGSDKAAWDDPEEAQLVPVLEREEMSLTVPLSLLPLPLGLRYTA
jgi:hypothetical protein